MHNIGTGVVLCIVHHAGNGECVCVCCRRLPVLDRLDVRCSSLFRLYRHQPRGTTAQVFTVNKCPDIIVQVWSAEIGRNVKCLSVRVDVCTCIHTSSHFIWLSKPVATILLVYRRAADYCYNYYSILRCVSFHCGCAIVPDIILAKFW